MIRIGVRPSALKAAGYARYSTSLQNPRSIEDQVREVREASDKLGWTLVETYADAAISGSSMKRPGIQSLLRDMQEAGLT